MHTKVLQMSGLDRAFLEDLQRTNFGREEFKEVRVWLGALPLAVQGWNAVA